MGYTDFWRKLFGWLAAWTAAVLPPPGIIRLAGEFVTTNTLNGDFSHATTVAGEFRLQETLEGQT